MEVRNVEPCVAQIRVRKPRVCRVGIAQVCVNQVAMTQVCASQMRSLEISSGQIAPARRLFLDVPLTQIVPLPENRRFAPRQGSLPKIMNAHETS